MSQYKAFLNVLSAEISERKYIIGLYDIGVNSSPAARQRLGMSAKVIPSFISIRCDKTRLRLWMITFV